MGVSPSRTDRKAQALGAGDPAAGVQLFPQLAGRDTEHGLFYVEHLRQHGSNCAECRSAGRVAGNGMRGQSARIEVACSER